jgi:hypothetical protein
VSKHFERWKELAALCLREQDPAKLTELANEMNLALTQKTSHLDPPLDGPSPRPMKRADYDDVLIGATE